MRTYLDCYPCVMRQALSAARLAGADDAAQLGVLRATLDLLRAAPPDATPPELAHQVHCIVRNRVGTGDPYAVVKEVSTRAALELYPRLKALVAAADDPLATAVRISIAGNIIDLGVSDDVPDLWATVERVLAAPLSVDHLPQLRTALAAADRVLLLADNAGETVFDRVLVEELDVPVTYAVKGGPVLNDATRTDAVQAGLEACATVVDNGADAPGTILALCSPEFRATFLAAPLVLAKGQANYETLSDAGPRVFTLLQAKCPVIARHLGVDVGGVVVRQSAPETRTPIDG